MKLEALSLYLIDSFQNNLLISAFGMVAISVLYAFAGLLQAAASRSFKPLTEAFDPAPKLKSDFQKANTTAQWAPGYPKVWGSEDFHLQFNEPEPDDVFRGVVTEDEKYLAMFNGSHVKFVDLDTNATMSIFKLGNARIAYGSGLTLRATAQGGYDVLTQGAENYSSNANTIYRQRVASDLQPVGEPTSFSCGEIGDIDKNGRIATTCGDIYDLNSPNATSVKLNSSTKITGMSFSSDGQYISTVGWEARTADLWNATTGEKILEFPPTNAQNWVTKISPDNKYVLISLGTRYLQIYSLANLTAAPRVLGPTFFNDWMRSIEWSPDSKFLAIGDAGRMRLWKVPELELVQSWEIDRSAGGQVIETNGLVWFDNGNKVSWEHLYGRYMYDFEKNVKWWWSVGVNDHSWGGGGVYFLKKRGYVATEDGDSVMRFWKI